MPKIDAFQVFRMLKERRDDAPEWLKPKIDELPATKEEAAARLTQLEAEKAKLPG